MLTLHKAFCCKLRTGAFMIATYYSVMSTIGVAFVLIQTCLRLIEPLKYRGKPYDLPSCLLVPYFLSTMAVDISLLYGIKMEQRKLMLPWLIFNGVFLISYIYVILAYVITSPQILISLFIVLPASMMYQVIFSYYKELKLRDDMNQMIVDAQGNVMIQECLA